MDSSLKGKCIYCYKDADRILTIADTVEPLGFKTDITCEECGDSIINTVEVFSVELFDGRCDCVNCQVANFEMCMNGFCSECLDELNGADNSDGLCDDCTADTFYTSCGKCEWFGIPIDSDGFAPDLCAVCEWSETLSIQCLSLTGLVLRERWGIDNYSKNRKGKGMTYQYRTRQELDICADCLHVSHSGAPDYDGYTESGHGERYAEAVKEWGDFPIVYDDTESFFSKWPCEFCGDPLAGGRFVSSLMQLHTVIQCLSLTVSAVGGGEQITIPERKGRQCRQ